MSTSVSVAASFSLEPRCAGGMMRDEKTAGVRLVWMTKKKKEKRKNPKSNQKFHNQTGTKQASGS